MGSEGGGQEGAVAQPQLIPAVISNGMTPEKRSRFIPDPSLYSFLIQDPDASIAHEHTRPAFSPDPLGHHSCFAGGAENMYGTHENVPLRT
jgi:hypothetical protein